MSRTADVLLCEATVHPTLPCDNTVACARGCGHVVDVRAGASIAELIGAALHDCPLRAEVMADILADLEAPVGAP